MRHLAIGVVAALSLVSVASAREISFEDRVAAQKAIEQVYWSHRAWPADNPGPKPALKVVLPDARLRDRVENYLRRSRVTPQLSHAGLQAELDRMASSTRDPQLLRELFDALGNDPHLIVETLVRPALVAGRDQGPVEIGGFREPGGAYALPSIAAVTLAVSTVPAARSAHTATAIGSQMIVWGGEPLTNTGGIYDPTSDIWIALSTAGAPSARSRHSAVYTGVELIVWGGLTAGGDVNTGGIYVPATDTWSPTSTGANVPSARERHTAVWTGSKMIVWGGSATGALTNTGGSYDPATDSWTATSTGANNSTARQQHTAVWTGSQMVVWGGIDAVGKLNTGGRYTPGSDAWATTLLTGAPVARFRHTAVWTGAQMIVWGGYGSTYLNSGGRYNPTLNSWSLMAGTPSVRADHTAVWTGNEMVIFGGQGPSSVVGNGGRYNPTSNAWTLFNASAGSPAARTGHAAIWSGSQMIVWGGTTGVTPLDNGGRYSPGTAEWSSTMTAPPSIRSQPRARAGCFGGSATFGVETRGNGPLTYQWRKDGIDIPAGPGVSGATSDTLVLPGLEAADAGAYSVVVTNPVSSLTSNDAALTVAPPRGGDVDPAFHRSGNFGSGGGFVFAQADGKTLVVGTIRGITRLNADGSTDLGFMTGLAGVNGSVWSAVQQPDGRILIGGTFNTVHGVERKRIARLNADGTLDTTFQNGMNGANDIVTAIGLQPDGKVLIGGWFDYVNGDVTSADLHHHVARLNADGSTDTSFIHGSGTGFQSVRGLNTFVVQPDGKILVGGSFNQVNGVVRIGLTRLNADGTTDPSFLTGMSGPDNEVESLTLQPDGRVLVGGIFFQFNGVETQGLVRMNPDGSLDPSFQRPAGLYPRGSPMLLQSNGKVITCLYNATQDGRVVRLNTDGTVDPSFQDTSLSSCFGPSVRYDGKVVVAGTLNNRYQVVQLNFDGSLDPSFSTPRTGGLGGVAAVAIQPDGRTIVGGGFNEVDGSPRSRIARLNADGTLDPSFHPLLTEEYAQEQISAVALQPDGRILIAGHFDEVDGIAHHDVARLLPDGKVDPTFQDVSFDENPYGLEALTLQPDGRVLIGGDFYLVNGAYRGHVARLNADGSLDTTFMNGMSGVEYFGVTAIANAPGGQIYIGGPFEAVNGTTRTSMARLNADGSLDPAFSLPPLTGSLYNYLNTLAVQPDGRVVVAQLKSVASQPNEYASVVRRVNPDGSLDASFDSPLVGPDYETNPNARIPVQRILVQPDGRILLGGAFRAVAGVPRANLARLNADGTLDTSFVDTMIGVTGQVHDLALLPDGRILAAGGIGGANDVASSGIVRLYGSAPVVPAIGTEPVNQVSYEGSCAVFHVTASGTPLDYRWRRGGVDLIDGPNVSGSQSATLTLTGVSAGDVGDYDCVVTNVLGGATTVPASLSLATIPACKIATCDPVLGSVLVDAPVPAEIASVQLVGQVSTTLSWIDLGGGALYDVASSTLADLRSVGIAGATCLANDVSGAGYADTQPSPSPGSAYYYIVRGQSACGAGGYGTDSEGVPRVPAAACP